MSSQSDIRELDKRSREFRNDLRQLADSVQRSLQQTNATVIDSLLGQRQDSAALQTGFAQLQAGMTASMQPLLVQLEQMAVALNRPTPPGPPTLGQKHLAVSGTTSQGSSVCISATMTSLRCPTGCRCRCHVNSSVRTPQWLKDTFGQLLWSYNTSMSIKSCSYAPCRKSLGKHHFTYYFPTWLVSRAIVASAKLDDLYGAGAKMSVTIPLIIPEEQHIVWPLVMAGNLEHIRQLMSQDRNLMYARNQWGQNIMHVAAKIHQPHIFNFLLSIGMDEHVPDENQKTATTTVLTRRGREDYALKVDAEDIAERLEWTPLHKAAALIREGYQLNEGLLQSEYPDINRRDSLGRTPLHWLAENGEVDAIRLLTQDPWEADVQVRDVSGFTPLHCACWADNVDTATVLLEAGSDPNALDGHKRTPLMHFDDTRLLDLHLAKGADVYREDDEGCNILHHVAVSIQAGLAKILLERYGHTLFTPNHVGDTPLHSALSNNSLDVLGLMAAHMKWFPEENISLPNHSRRTILHLAALRSSIEAMHIVSTAKLFGLDPSARDIDGHTANECFLECRDAHCAVARRSPAEERSAWTTLVNAVRKQSDVPLFERVSCEDEDEDGEGLASCWPYADTRDSKSELDQSDSDTGSDHDFADAEETLLPD
ncbi:hypothetical protein LTR85_002706 [Meristemomyces frigidus]|nr:hypothetical protein LTR85_002706 [Meristemomyces frigidus]